MDFAQSRLERRAAWRVAPEVTRQKGRCWSEPLTLLLEGLVPWEQSAPLHIVVCGSSSPEGEQVCLMRNEMGEEEEEAAMCWNANTLLRALIVVGCVI